jgi:hypothetical protein
LEAVRDPPPAWSVLLLERHRLPEKIEAGDGGLPAVPGKADDIVGTGRDMLDDVLFEEIIGHDHGRARRGKRLLDVVAVATAKVADRADWLDENLEPMGGASHRSARCASHPREVAG